MKILAVDDPQIDRSSKDDNTVGAHTFERLLATANDALDDVEEGPRASHTFNDQVLSYLQGVGYSNVEMKYHKERVISLNEFKGKVESNDVIDYVFQFAEVDMVSSLINAYQGPGPVGPGEEEGSRYGNVELTEPEEFLGLTHYNATY
jgi:hypothetical protein